MQFLTGSRRKKRRFFPCGVFLSRVVGECLSKCPIPRKLHYPKKFLVTRLTLPLFDVLSENVFTFDWMWLFLKKKHIVNLTKIFFFFSKRDCLSVRFDIMPLTFRKKETAQRFFLLKQIFPTI